jgi:hypothetical protein
VRGVGTLTDGRHIRRRKMRWVACSPYHSTGHAIVDPSKMGHLKQTGFIVLWRSVRY